MIFLAVYHRRRRKTSRGEVERRVLICYTKADESEAIMKKIKYMAVVLATGLLLAGCEEDETQNNKDAYRQIGINCMQEGDYEGAIDAFQNALDQSLAVVGEEEIDTCYYKAAAQYAAGKKEDAIETYQALINYDKKNAQAYFLLGELYRKENDMDKAKENFNLAAQYAGTDYEMYIALYQECYAAGMQTEGQEYLKKGIEAGGKSAEDYAQRGRIYLLLGDYDNAETELTTAINKKSTEASLYMAQLYEVKGEDEKAAGLYKEYIDENQDNPTALICLGGMELEKGNYDSAINYLKMALDLDAGSQKQEAQRNLILAYEQSGDFASAKSEMEDYTKNYPNDEEAAREYLFLMTR